MNKTSTRPTAPVVKLSAISEDGSAAKPNLPLRPSAWLEILKEWGEPAFRAKQVAHWLAEQKNLDVATWTTFSKPLREKILETYGLPLAVTRELVSKGEETTKFESQLRDGHRIESVIIRAPGRTTLCVSSQVGCGMGCRFCATGTMGHLRNLSVDEILGQVLIAWQMAGGLTHLVFMGMGEPLANYPRVRDTVRALSEEFGFSARRITISTSGLIPPMRRLAADNLGCRLAVSLTSALAESRSALMPINDAHALPDLIQTIRDYQIQTDSRVTLECALMAGINDDRPHADALARLALSLGCHVNLIPFNPTPGLPFQRPQPEVVQAFRATLEQAGVNVTWRYRKGSDVAAACGQLVTSTT